MVGCYQSRLINNARRFDCRVNQHDQLGAKRAGFLNYPVTSRNPAFTVLIPKGTVALGLIA